MIGQMRSSLCRDQADFQTAHGDAGVTALQVGVKTGTGLELEHVVVFVHGPDAGKGCPQIVHHRLRAPPQHLGEVTALDQMGTDPRAEGL